MTNNMNVLRELWWLFSLFLAASAWIAFAEHPTARRLRIAVGDSLGL